MRDLDFRIDCLASDARSIMADVEFRAGLTHCALAKEAIDAVAADAERYRLEAAERETPRRAAA